MRIPVVIPDGSLDSPNWESAKLIKLVVVQRGRIKDDQPDLNGLILGVCIVHDGRVVARRIKDIKALEGWEVADDD